MPPSDVSTSTRLLGRYAVQQLLADGPLLQIWDGWDLEHDRPIAVAMLAPSLAGNRQAAERFAQEERGTRDLAGHPHVLTVHAVEEEAGRPFAVTDRPPTATLADRLAGHGRPPVDDALRWLRQIASALDAAQERDLVHGDLRPANLLLDADENLLVARFGIAALVWGSTLGSVRKAIGTASYLAPEQVLDEPATPASDRFALAVIAFEMLTGALPFDGDDFTSSAHARAENRPARPSRLAPDLPRDLDVILLVGLHRDPARRWSSGGLLIEALEATLSPENVEDPGGEPETGELDVPPAAAPAEDAPTQAAKAGSRRGRLVTAGLTLATLAVAALTVVTLVAAIRDYDETPGDDASQAGGSQPVRSRDDRPSPDPGARSPIPEAGAAGVDDEAAERLNSEGYDLIRAGRYEEAAERLRAGARRAAAGDQTYATSLLLLARALRRGGDPRAALTVIKRRVELPPRTETSQRELRLSRQAVQAAGE